MLGLFSKLWGCKEKKNLISNLGGGCIEKVDVESKFRGVFRIILLRSAFFSSGWVVAYPGLANLWKHKPVSS